MEVEGKPLGLGKPITTYASFSKLNDAAALISKSEYPLILAGNGVIRDNASDALVEFATRLNIPVVNTFMGKGAIPYTHPLSLWTTGLQKRDVASCCFDRADLVIAVGYDLVEYSPKKWNPDGTIPIVHVSLMESETDSSYIPEVDVVGNIADSLVEILRRADRRTKNDDFISGVRSRLLENYENYAQDEGFPIKPQKIIYDVRQVMGSDDIVISDVGAHKMWIARHYHCDRPNTCLISNGFAAMGIAIPGALAAKLVYPDRRIIAMTGDGGFMMNCQELETALRAKTPFVTLVFNDGGYGLIEWKQQDQFRRSRFIEFGNPDFVKFAESMGLKGYRVNSADDLLPTLKEAFEQDVPTVIDCPVDYQENLRLSQKSGELECAT